METEILAFIGSVIGAIGGLAGSLIDRDTGKSAASAKTQDDRYNYRHRYQWQMEDMRRAGLNPILSYKAGAPGLPGAATYSSNVAGGVAAGVSSAVAAQRVKAEIENIKADTAMKNEQKVVATTQHQLNDVQAARIAQDWRINELEAWSTAELLEMLQSGGEGTEIMAALNRLRRLLGFGGSK